MAVDDTAPRAPRQGPIALADLFDAALKDLTPNPNPRAPAPMAVPTPAASGAAFLFSGNRHESVPRRLPVLRLTRWLSLVRRRRDPKTGRILGNLYVLHDEPLTLFEAMQLDADYLALVSQSLGHSAKAVRVGGLNTLQEIADDPMLSGRTLPPRLQVLAERRADQGITATASYPHEDAIHDSEEGPASLLRNGERPSSESEAGPKPAPDGALRNPKQDRTVRSSRIDEVRTTAQARALGDLQWPKRFAELKAEQQAGARMALPQGDAALRQAVLDEWAARCGKHGIRNPAQPGSANPIGGASATARAAAQRRAARGGPAAHRAPARSAAQILSAGPGKAMKQTSLAVGRNGPQGTAVW